ncbi:MAG: hypothetical protein H6883_02195 [Rhodobiaceae bacterium]|nr:hypothetical protein [Rhodobiaceae bacterium]MCC0054928.1 hypothetical protein [Rhodobiaceae bacterium]
MTAVRILTATCLIWLALAIPDASAQQSQRTNAGTAPDPAATLVIPNPLPVEIVDSPEASAARDRSAAEAAKREADALAVQQSLDASSKEMAAATKELRDYAFISMLVGAASAVSLFFALYLTSRANEHARKSFQITRNLSKRQQRAYLHTHKLGAQFMKDYNLIEITGSVKNYGNSPARKARLVHLWAAEEEFDEAWWDLEFEKTSEGSVPQSGKVEFVIRTASSIDPRKSLTREQVLEIYSGRLSLWVIIKISYEDIFGDEQMTFERHMLHQFPDGSFRFVFEPTEKEDT